MSTPEKQSPSIEKQNSIETGLDVLDQKKELLEDLEAKAEKNVSNDAAEKLARKKVEQEALSVESESNESASVNENKQEDWVDLGKTAKNASFKKSMEKVQAQMKPSSRIFSKFIHSPAIEVISEITAKTIARPSSLMGAGATGLVGIVGITFLAKHSGFALSGSELPFLMVGGAIVGVSAEVALRLIRKLSN